MADSSQSLARAKQKLNLPKEMADLIDLIEEAKKSSGVSVDKELWADVARVLYGDEASVTESNHLKGIRSGKKAPSLLWLMALYTAIHAKGDAQRLWRRENDMQKWLAYWLGHQIEFAKRNNQKRGKRKFSLDDEFLNKWSAVTENLKKSLAEAPSPPSASAKLPTLERFPHAFSPLIVITGSGRSLPPRNLEELFRTNKQSHDLTFLCRLNLDPSTLVIPDRFLITLTKKQRVELLRDKHILSDGGPLVNVITRYLCQTSVFSFHFHERHREFNDIFDYIQEKNILISAAHFKHFYQCLNDPELGLSATNEAEDLSKSDQRRISELAAEIRKKADVPNGTYADIMQIFMPQQIFDPARLRLSAQLDTEDIGIISMGPNPWDQDDKGNLRYQRTAVIAAGWHGLGSAHSMAMLAEPNNFLHRPLGGFFKVTEGQKFPSTAYSRFIEAKASWDDELLTPAYTIASIRESLKEQLSLDPKRRLNATHYFPNDDAIRKFIEFLRRIDPETAN
ncbi:MAG: hypothetical protein J2P41_03700 [Blastocatellia bacterium]|nr:hypothetical protein [Blastocatellia bacterium]